MDFIIKLTALAIILTSVESLEPLQKNNDVLKDIIQVLSNRILYPRRSHANNLKPLKKIKSLYEKLTRGMSKNEIKQVLRENSKLEKKTEPFDQAQDILIEKELQSTLNKKSAILEPTIVTSDGPNEYLMIGVQDVDHFVTVLPNSMYQQIEKKCVNWLDDCSLKGIRARLLRGVRSPYR